jgi:hypothetical protein
MYILQSLSASLTSTNEKPEGVLDALLVQRQSRSRHVVLPAYQASHFAYVGVDDLQPVSCATTPDKSLSCGWYQL